MHTVTRASRTRIIVRIHHIGKPFFLANQHHSQEECSRDGGCPERSRGEGGSQKGGSQEGGTFVDTRSHSSMETPLSALGGSPRLGPLSLVPPTSRLFFTACRGA